MSEKKNHSHFASITKFVVVAFIVFVAVFLDQWSKFWAEDNLASPRYDHTIDVVVPQSEQTSTLEQFVKTAYPDANETNQKYMVASASRNGEKLFASNEVNPGDKISFNYVTKTVIEGYFDYQYARNPGAAWSFLADQSPRFRGIFFGITGILAVILMFGFIIASKWKTQKPLIIFLACILGGAVGNIIDRFRMGYVIDFISWHVGEHYWPTFNIADIFVTCGVALLIIDLIIHRNDKDNKESDAKAEESAKTEDGAKAEESAKAEDGAKAEDSAKAEESTKAEESAKADDGE